MRRLTRSCCRTSQRQVFADSCCIEKIMAKHAASNFHYRHEFAVFRLKHRITADIDNPDQKDELAAQALKRGEHVIAQMAIGSAIDGQDRLTYRPHP